MTRRNKLLKFTQILTFSNVFETTEIQSPILAGKDGELTAMNGEWNKKFFNNPNPITLELACGKGDYTLALAGRYPDRNFIGVDIKGARIWKAARMALDNDVKNVAFLRCKIEFIAQYFNKDEISEIWITFPDPFLKESKYNRRMTSPSFLESYKKILVGDGLIHVKTDSPELYEHTKNVLSEQDIALIDDYYDIYSERTLPHPDLDIKTFYELKHLEIGRKIKFLKFNPNLLVSSDK